MHQLYRHSREGLQVGYNSGDKHGKADKEKRGLLAYLTSDLQLPLKMTSEFITSHLIIPLQEDVASIDDIRKWARQNAELQDVTKLPTEMRLAKKNVQTALSDWANAEHQIATSTQFMSLFEKNKGTIPNSNALGTVMSIMLDEMMDTKPFANIKEILRLQQRQLNDNGIDINDTKGKIEFLMQARGIHAGDKE